MAMLVANAGCGTDASTTTSRRALTPTSAARATTTSTAPIAPAPTTTTTSPVTTGTASTTLPPKNIARVIEVVDGDTIRADYGGVNESIRLIGFDAPESGEPFSDEATRALAALVGDREVELEFDVDRRDQYDRLLAYLWVGSTLVNAEMLRAGLATLYTVPPNVAHVETLQQAQDEAHGAGRGIWGAPAGPPVEVVSAHYNAAGNDHDNLNDEYIVFRVLVSGTLAGYSVEDDAGHRYVFPDRIFEAGQTLTLHTGSGADSSTELYWRSRSAIWNNDGDTVKVLDPQGHVVAEHAN